MISFAFEGTLHQTLHRDVVELVPRFGYTSSDGKRCGMKAQKAGWVPFKEVMTSLSRNISNQLSRSV